MSFSAASVSLIAPGLVLPPPLTMMQSWLRMCELYLQSRTGRTLAGVKNGIIFTRHPVWIHYEMGKGSESCPLETPCPLTAGEFQHVPLPSTVLQRPWCHVPVKTWISTTSHPADLFFTTCQTTTFKQSLQVVLNRHCQTFSQSPSM